MDEDGLRDEAIRQLLENLRMCHRVMTDSKLDLKTRERWAQKHAYAAHTLGELLRDRQYREWEKRLKELEDSGRVLRRTWIPLEVLRDQEQTTRTRAADQVGSG